MGLAGSPSIARELPRPKAISEGGKQSRRSPTTGVPDFSGSRRALQLGRSWPECYTRPPRVPILDRQRTPRAAGSPSVNKQIVEFKAVGGVNRVLALIVDGESNVSLGKTGFKEEDEHFPPALGFRVGSDGHPSEERTEPLAADIAYRHSTGDGGHHPINFFETLSRTGVTEYIYRTTIRYDINGKIFWWLQSVEQRTLIITAGYRDTYGNRLLRDQGEQRNLLFYTDALIPPGEWPGFLFHLFPSGPGEVTIEAHYERPSEHDPGDLERKLSLIRAQVQGTDVEVTLTNEATDDGAHHFTFSPLDGRGSLRKQLLDLLDAALQGTVSGSAALRSLGEAE